MIEFFREATVEVPICDGSTSFAPTTIELSNEAIGETGKKTYWSFMEITIEDLRRIIASSVDVGVQKYIKTKEPENDRMKQSEAQRYIQKLGYQP